MIRRWMRIIASRSWWRSGDFISLNKAIEEMTLKEDTNIDSDWIEYWSEFGCNCWDVGIALAGVIGNRLSGTVGMGLSGADGNGPRIAWEGDMLLWAASLLGFGWFWCRSVSNSKSNERWRVIAYRKSRKRSSHRSVSRHHFLGRIQWLINRYGRCRTQWLNDSRSRRLRNHSRHWQRSWSQQISKEKSTLALEL